MKEKYSEAGRNPYDSLRPMSALTHGIGILFALLALGVLQQMTRNTPNITPVTVYALSMLCLYTASTVYHSLNTGIKGRMFLRKLDHVMIYFLIAGTYTPVCMISLDGTISGRIMLLIIWSMAILGSGFTLFWINMPRFLTAIIYLVMGWTAIFAIYPIHQALSGECFFLLLLGGILYSLGGILYALKWPGRNNRYFGCHEIFHVFIVLGSISHFLMIYQLVK